MGRVFVVRHGESEWNSGVAKRLREDVRLTETGVAQAHSLAGIFKEISWDAIYSSPLTRAQHTARIASSRSDILIDPRITETYFGEMEKIEIDQKKWMDVWQEYWEGNTGLIAGAETFEDMKTRVDNFLNEILTAHKGKDILLVTHGGTQKFIWCYFNEHPSDSNYHKISPLGNCEYFVETF